MSDPQPEASSADDDLDETLDEEVVEGADYESTGDVDEVDDVDDVDDDIVFEDLSVVEDDDDDDDADDGDADVEDDVEDDVVEDDEDEDDLDDELDELLEEDEEVQPLDEEEGGGKKGKPRRKPELISEDEFTCRSCFLVKKPTQLADPAEMLCFDCV